jgi:hypothetical protein
MRLALWELFFMLVILKIPIVYLCLVVWWAVRAEPQPYEGAALPARLPEPSPCPWRRPRGGPRRGPEPRFTRRAAVARASLVR